MQCRNFVNITRNHTLCWYDDGKVNDCYLQLYQVLSTFFICVLCYDPGCLHVYDSTHNIDISYRSPPVIASHIAGFDKIELCKDFEMAKIIAVRYGVIMKYYSSLLFINQLFII